MTGLDFARLDEVVVLGAHCDDVAIGAGATLATLHARSRGLRVHALPRRRKRDYRPAARAPAVTGRALR